MSRHSIEVCSHAGKIFPQWCLMLLKSLEMSWRGGEIFAAENAATLLAAEGGETECLVADGVFLWQ